MQKNMGWPMQKKHRLANAEKAWVGQCRKNMGWPMQKKYGLANAEKTCLGQCRKTIKPKGAALRAAPLGFIFSALTNPYFFCIWPAHIFSAFGPRICFWHFAQHRFFCISPIIVFLAGRQSIFYQLLCINPGSQNCTKTMLLEENFQKKSCCRSLEALEL